MAYTAPPLRRPPAQSPSPYGASNPPTIAPPPTFDPGYHPPGGHSANFYASVAANNAAAKARQDTFAAGATPAAPVTDGAGAPKMGMAKVGDEVRYYPQTADSPETIAARKAANVAGGAAGAAASAASLGASQARFDAQHPPLIDPKTLVAKALAGKYDAEGDAAKTKAGNDTTRAKSAVALNEAHQKYWGTLGDAARVKADADAKAAIARGDLDAAMKIYTGERAETERQTRTGKVEGQTIKNTATQDANARANAANPSIIYKNTAQGVKASTNPLSGEPIAGAPQPPPMTYPPAGLAPAAPAAAATNPPTTTAPAPYQPPTPVQPIPVPPAPVAAPAPAQTAPAAPPAPAIPQPQQPHAPAVGATAVNRQTGQRVRWSGTAWEVAQ